MVEHDLAKVGAAGSIPVSRSKIHLEGLLVLRVSKLISVCVCGRFS